MNDTEKLYEIKDQLYQILENYLTYSNNDFEVRIERMIDMIESPSTPCYHKDMYDDAKKQCMGLYTENLSLKQELEYNKRDIRKLTRQLSDIKKVNDLNLDDIRTNIQTMYECIYELREMI